MRIVFFGAPESALPSLEGLLRAGHSIELVITQPDRPSGRGKHLVPCPVKRFASQKEIPVFQPEKIRQDALALETINSARPDINVVVAYGQILPRSIIDLPPRHSVNVHFSLLPKYRGASPVQWAIFNGEQRTGVTIFLLNEKMDEGDILAQEEMDIRPREKAFELESRLAEGGAALLVQTLREIDRMTPVPQNHALATYAPKLRKKDGQVDWTKPAELIGRQVRAFSPWPSAFTFAGTTRIKIVEGETLPLPEKRGGGQPGTVIAVRKEGLEVGCGGGTVFLIARLQPEGKKEMEAYAFSLGSKTKIGDVLR